MANEMRRLARRLNSIDARARASSKPGQAAHTVINGPGGVVQVNDDGNPVQIVGTQPDGTTGVVQYNGPTPPQPTMPVCTVLNGSVNVSWNGGWVDSLTPPLDLARIDIHIVEDPLVDPLTTTPIASIMSAGWGAAALPVEPGDYFAVLVAWTTSGKYSVSEFSEPFFVEAITPTTDGVPPLTAPELTARPFAVGGVELTWKLSEGPDPKTYRVYASTTQPVPRDESHKVAEVYEGDTAVVSSLADGTPLSYDSLTWFVVEASDGDPGVNPVSAEVSATPRKAGNAEISAEYAYLGEIEGRNIKASSVAGDRFTSDLMVSSKMVTGAPTDPRIELEGPHFRAYETGTKLAVSIAPEGSEFSGKGTFARLKSFLETELGGLVRGLGGGKFILQHGPYGAPPERLVHASVPEVEGTFTSSDTSTRESMLFAGHPTYNPTLLHRVSCQGRRIWVTRDSAVDGTPLNYTWSWYYSGAYIGDFVKVLGFAQTTSTTAHFLVKTRVQMAPEVYETRYHIIRGTVPTSNSTVNIARTAVYDYTPAGVSTDDPVMCGQPGTTRLIIARRLTSAQSLGGIAFNANEVVAQALPAPTGSALGTVEFTVRPHLQTVAGPVEQVVAAPLDSHFDGSTFAGTTGDNLTLAMASKEGFGPFAVNKLYAIVRPSTGEISDGPLAPFWYTPARGGCGLTYSWSLDRFVDGLSDGSGFNVYAKSGVSANDTFHTYTLYDSVANKESAPAPLYGGTSGTGTGLFPRLVSRWTIPGLPPIADKVRVYSSLNNDPTKFQRVQTLDRSDATEVRKLASVMPPVTPTLPMPAASNLTGGDPFEIKDEAGTWFLKGDGTSSFVLQSAFTTLMTALSDRVTALESLTPHIRVHQAGAFSASASWTQVPFDSTSESQGGTSREPGGADGGTQGTVVIPQDGVYAVDAKLLLSPTTSLTAVGIAVQITRAVGGTPTVVLTDYGYEQKTGTANYGAPADIVGKYMLKAGDKVALLVQSSMGAHSLNISNNAFNTMSVTRIGA